MSLVGHPSDLAKTEQLSVASFSCRQIVRTKMVGPRDSPIAQRQVARAPLPRRLISRLSAGQLLPIAAGVFLFAVFAIVGPSVRVPARSVGEDRRLGSGE